MADEIEFINGLIIKPPHERAPEFVKCKLSFKREELIAWLQSKEGDWINADVKVSNGGKWYAAVDNWKPNTEGGGSSGSRGGAPQRERPVQATQQSPDPNYDDQDIPFLSQRGNF